MHVACRSQSLALSTLPCAACTLRAHRDWPTTDWKADDRLIYIYKQSHRATQLGRQPNWLQTDMHTDRQPDRRAKREIQCHRAAHRQTQTDTNTNRHRHRHTGYTIQKYYKTKVLFQPKVLQDKGIIDKGIIRPKVLQDKGITSPELRFNQYL